MSHSRSAEPENVAAAGAGSLPLPLAGEGWGEGCGEGAAAGALAAAPSASIDRITLPSLTLSPTFTFSSFTTPACDDGISIDALSLSTVTSDCSAFTGSPG